MVTASLLFLNIHQPLFSYFCYSSMRVLPHDQDTGGFFVAVIRKISDMPYGEERTNLSAEGVSAPMVVVLCHSVSFISLIKSFY